jgi:hypothetical protein
MPVLCGYFSECSGTQMDAVDLIERLGLILTIVRHLISEKKLPVRSLHVRSCRYRRERCIQRRLGPQWRTSRMAFGPANAVA